MAAKHLPSPDIIRQLLTYDRETGLLFWLPRPDSMFPTVRAARSWNGSFAGREAMTATTNNGYKVGTIFDVKVFAHRVIWAIEKGEWPRQFIDHINGKKADNRLLNLRMVSRRENARNAPAPITNTSGAVGVYQVPSGNWVAKIYARGKRVHIGTYATFADAEMARKSSERKLGYHENHGRFATQNRPS